MQCMTKSEGEAATVVRNRKHIKTDLPIMDYDASPTISNDYLSEEEEPLTTVREPAVLNEDGESSSGLHANDFDGSHESLASATEVGCSRFIGEIGAGLAADLNAAKVIFHLCLKRVFFIICYHDF